MRRSKHGTAIAMLKVIEASIIFGFFAFIILGTLYGWIPILEPKYYVLLFAVGVFLLGILVCSFVKGRTVGEHVRKGFRITYHQFPWSFVGVLVAVLALCGYGVAGMVISVRLGVMSPGEVAIAGIVALTIIAFVVVLTSMVIAVKGGARR